MHRSRDGAHSRSIRCSARSLALALASALHGVTDLFPRSHWVCFTLLASAACGSVRKIPEPTPDAALPNADGGQSDVGGAEFTSGSGGITSDNGGSGGVAGCSNSDCSGGASLG